MHYESKSQIVIKNEHIQHAHSPFDFVVTHQFNYSTNQMDNLQLPTEETALNFQYSDVSSCNTLFHGQSWSFQQDSAPAHKAWATQQWQETNVPDFISTSDWPSASPDLNPLDYKLWSKLQEMACKQRHPNIESLKWSLQKAAADFPVDMLHNSIYEQPQRLKDCVHANGGHFE